MVRTPRREPWGWGRRLMTESVERQTACYWQSERGAEIDFVIRRAGQLIPIEVKYDVPGNYRLQLHSDQRRSSKVSHWAYVGSTM